jgi:glycosyltransferase involved in cell wall biosynthesis
MKIALVHFQPLEKYPPVMNCIRDLEKEKVTALKIFSSHSKNNWFSSSYPIYRLGNYTTFRWSRYWTYLYFNLACFFFLCYYRPKKVLYYETYSAWPVFWYKKLFPAVVVFIHFHEYVSEKEKKESTSYFKYLLKKEAYNLNNASWISHTNEDRMQLFQQEYPFLSINQCHILPNYPPADWAIRAQQIRANRQVSAIKRMVYVGALGLESTYIIEIAAWIVEQKGVYTLDIYGSNMDIAVLNYLLNIKTSYISINNAIPYYELPELLATYDICLVLYKCIIPNHIFSVPNKVFEYLACGLQVWYSEELVSTNKFKQEYDIQQLISISFTKLISLPEKNVFAIFDAPHKIHEKSQLVSKLIAA